MMLIVRSFFRVCHLHTLVYIHVCFYCFLISGGNVLPTTRLPLLRYLFATNGSLISIIFTLLQNYFIPGRRYLLESMSPEFIMIQCEIHCPLLPTPSRTGMKCALNWSEIHHMQQQWALLCLYSWCEIDTLSFLLTCSVTSIAAFMLNSNCFEQSGSATAHKWFSASV